MPWKELCAMGLREDFVIKARSPGTNFAALCREYGVSRKTGYKWLDRYNKEGVSGLEDLSRRPKETPLAVSADVAVFIVELRLAHPTWGSKKLAVLAEKRLPPGTAPKRATIDRILTRAGLVQRGHRRLQRFGGPSRKPTVVAKAPNDVWTVDFKGWWLALDKGRCEPLTIRDAFSRYVLHIEVLSTTALPPVRAVFEAVFARYGLPKVILTDNGTPFVSSFNVLGLTKLSAWWLSLGIEHIRTRPATPSDNGGHERMHRDMAAELERFKALNRFKQQEACERWRLDFNCIRPHEALGMKCPKDVYRESRVRFIAGRPVEPEYPEDFDVRLVGKRGGITWGDKPVFISNALAHQRVGLELLGDSCARVWFGTKRLGQIDFNKTPIQFAAEPWVDTAVTHSELHGAGIDDTPAPDGRILPPARRANR